uniref:Uncharacterized protein n=1 Tax=viral metagenome TaxID=1070528 RepID=A0A6C0HRT7_9ZZZZ
MESNGLNECDSYNTSIMIANYESNISDIINTLKTNTTAATNNGTDIKNIVESSVSTLNEVDKSMEQSRNKINDCIRMFKTKKDEPEDMDTSNLMFENAKIVHREIIYNRIQIIIYICLLLFFCLQ